MAFNMDPKKCPMPTQDPNVRNKNFEEVALGYTEEMAVNEAKRCIHCKNKPCQTGCPVGIDIPEFIGHVAEGDFEAAYQVIARSSSLPAVCGRVCPQESQCESRCVRGIKGEPVAIGRLERFVADWHYFLKDLGEAMKDSSQETRKAVNMYMLNRFYVTPFGEDEDFYPQFYRRLEEAAAFAAGQGIRTGVSAGGIGR